MGGNAFLIWGMLADHQLQPAPIKRTFMDRIMGRQRFHKPSVMDFGGGRKMIDFPADKYRILAADFRAFLHERMPDPWPETRAFFDYLTDHAFFGGTENHQPGQAALGHFIFFLFPYPALGSVYLIFTIQP